MANYYTKYIGKEFIRKCPKCGIDIVHKNYNSYKDSIRLKRVCTTCSNKSWQIKKYGKKKIVYFKSICPRCKKIKKHYHKNTSPYHAKLLIKIASTKLCKHCSNEVYYKVPKHFKNTKPELKFKEYLEQNKINFFQQYKLINKYYDFYLSEYNLLVEVDGDYWHGKDILDENLLGLSQKKNRKNDKYKNELAKEHKINLLRIWETDINNNTFKEILNERIKTLNLGRKI